MSIKTTYKCDICEEVFEAQEELLQMILTISNPGYTYGHSINSKHVCPKCITKLGIELPSMDRNKSKDEEILKLLRDFVCDTVVDEGLVGEE